MRAEVGAEFPTRCRHTVVDRRNIRNPHVRPDPGGLGTRCRRLFPAQFQNYQARIQSVSMRRGDYGYDAPYALVMFGLISVGSGIGAAMAWLNGPIRAAMLFTFYFVFFLANTSSFLYTTRRGKFLEWDRILDRLCLRGDEEVLDMGCGRGAVLTAVARRLTTGRVTGVDIWSRKDQSGNAKSVTLRNASLEGVDDRVRVETSDVRALPYPDATFDLVVSSLAIHNIRSNAARKRAIGEGFRVLKPGGRMVIADIRATTIYADALRTLGASNVERRRLGWRFWWGNPIAGTTLLTASKAPV
jgi:SAM-dependent methyltransferase